MKDECVANRSSLISHPISIHKFRPAPDHRLRVVVAFDLLSSRLANLPSRFGVVQQVLGPAGDAGAWPGEEITGLFMFDQVAHAGHVGCDDRHARRHCFQHRLRLPHALAG